MSSCVYTMRFHFWRLVVAALSMSVMAMAAGPAAAAPKAELWTRWQAHDPTASTTIDHSSWQRFLKAYVRPHPDGVNRVAYALVSDEDRKVLADYLDELAATPISAYNRDEQRAYWINLYNALTVKVVLDHYPVRSIRKIRISPGLLAVGPWGKKLVTVEGEPLSLDDIEHRILRPIWRDPRIHYAVNCAAISCPSLQEDAFTGSNVDALLTRAAREYGNSAYGAEVRNGRLVVSSLYRWYKEDFGGSDEGVINHLRQYADAPLAASLSGAKRIADDRYDWGLNDVPLGP